MPKPPRWLALFLSEDEATLVYAMLVVLLSFVFIAAMHAVVI
jgi:hypothetical protein